MSSYGGRRGPNVTQFLNSLQSDTPSEEPFMDDDLALFTNTQFFDFDAGRTTDYQAPPVKSEPEPAPSSTTDDVGSSASPMGDLSGSLDFMQGQLDSALLPTKLTKPFTLESDLVR